VYSGAPLFLAKYDAASSASQQSKAMRFGFPATGALVDYERQQLPAGWVLRHRRDER